MSEQKELFGRDETPEHYIKRIGGEDAPLVTKDVAPLKAQRRRVARLMMDLQWHSRQTIGDVAQGAEGLRRMRELRQRGWVIEKRRLKDTRVWQYRATYIPQADYDILLEDL